MTDQNDARVEVIQSDREAAADYLADTNFDWGACDDVRQGRVTHALAFAFARHRIASAATARGDAVEECARALHERLPYPTLACSILGGLISEDRS